LPENQGRGKARTRWWVKWIGASLVRGRATRNTGRERGFPCTAIASAAVVQAFLNCLPGIKCFIWRSVGVGHHPSEPILSKANRMPKLQKIYDRARLFWTR